MIVSGVQRISLYKHLIIGQFMWLKIPDIILWMEEGEHCYVGVFREKSGSNNISELNL